MKLLLAPLAALTIAGTAHAVPMQWSSAVGGNDHYYEFVRSALDWNAAKADAASRSYAGLTGHLATITSADENAFAVSLTGTYWTWIGGTRDTGNSFSWKTGPEAGTTFYNSGTVSGVYHNFARGEPNNQGNENAVHLWSGGTWNDLVGSSSQYYLVEYSQPVQTPAPVPLPASGLLLAAATGALALRKRKG